MNNKFTEKSYCSHKNIFNEYTKDENKAEFAKTWFSQETVDSWRHDRMYNLVLPILRVFPESNWLTIGDGRYGKDAHVLKSKAPCATITATDLGETLLKKAHDMGFIDNYSSQNAEQLTYEDNEFDFVFCKEAYHHFPRPPVAFYEMLRVSKKAIILIEPNEIFFEQGTMEKLFMSFKQLIKRILNRKTEYYEYEESGNFLYRISKRELEKMAIALNLPYIAFKGINDVYIPNIEFEDKNKNLPLFRRLKRDINILNILCLLGFARSNIVCGIIFKEKPSPDLLEALRTDGFCVKTLPKNPYI